MKGDPCLTRCSSPGKVLITGGYLVLQQPLSGLVLSLSSRFEATIEDGDVHDDSSSDVCKVLCCSPQFETEVCYGVDLAKCHCSVIGDGSRNPYIANAILWSLKFSEMVTQRSEAFLARLKKGFRVTVLGDNDFYSQLDELERRNLPCTSESLASLPKHLRVGKGLNSMKKTGLGSSAAMVTCIVGAICAHVGNMKLPLRGEDIVEEEEDLQKIHNLAQFVHCLAQGKIGSGFDVSSACFGSQCYTRFSPTCLDALLKGAESNADHMETLLEQQLMKPWDNKHLRFRLPLGMKLVLGDVSVGSNTPLMVSKVLKWKKENAEEANLLWKAIAEHNDSIRHLFESIEKEGVSEEVKACSKVHHSEWSSSKTGNLLSKTRKAFVSARKGLKEMGTRADVPIEPEEQTALCDATMDIEGGKKLFHTLFVFLFLFFSPLWHSFVCWCAWSRRI